MRWSLPVIISLSLVAPGKAAAPPSEPARVKCAVKRPHWASARDPASNLPTNILTIHAGGAAPTWNGDPVLPQQILEYLKLIKTMQPTFMLLVTHPNASCAEILRYRGLIEHHLGCSPGRCGEVNL